MPTLQLNPSVLLMQLVNSLNSYGCARRLGQARVSHDETGAVLSATGCSRTRKVSKSMPVGPPLQTSNESTKPCRVDNLKQFRGEESFANQYSSGPQDHDDGSIVNSCTARVSITAKKKGESMSGARPKKRTMILH